MLVRDEALESRQVDEFRGIRPRNFAERRRLQHALHRRGIVQPQLGGAIPAGFGVLIGSINRVTLHLATQARQGRDDRAVDVEPVTTARGQRKAR